MTDLDTKLREILSKYSEWVVKNVEKGIFIPLPSPETEQAIKQAFADEGFHKDGHTSVTLPTYTTGQEWYDRFADNLPKEAVMPTNDARVYYKDDVLEAARKAAGL